MTTRAKCLLCNEWHDDILNHLRLFHPDHYSETERLGDGGIAIDDETEDDDG